MGIFGFDNGPSRPQTPFPMNMMQQFSDFCQTFQGDPRQKAQQLLNSGQMTQEQYSQLNNLYQTFGQLMWPFFHR